MVGKEFTVGKEFVRASHGCISEAASGNVVKFHIGGDFTNKILTGSTRQFQIYIYVGVL